MNTLLYILHINGREYVKIGITANIRQRIKTIKASSGFTVDPQKSLIITNHNKSNIRLLERNLLAITKEFALNWRQDVDFSGMHEFRKNSCTKRIVQWIKDQKNYGFDFKVYTGLDICGRYSKGKIPKHYFPVDKQIKGVSPILKNDVSAYCKKNNIQYADLLNLALYKYAVELGIDRKEDFTIEGYNNYYKI
ncbi:GIY-YIG nuclease family protein [Nonlabens agnitus]|nr:GIY-YIG nuclease family protein [Nonlabens agnitus]